MKNRHLQEYLAQFDPEAEVKIQVKSIDYWIEDGDLLLLEADKTTFQGYPKVLHVVAYWPEKELPTEACGLNHPCQEVGIGDA